MKTSSSNFYILYSTASTPILGNLKRWEWKEWRKLSLPSHIELSWREHKYFILYLVRIFRSSLVPEILFFNEWQLFWFLKWLQEHILSKNKLKRHGTCHVFMKGQGKIPSTEQLLQRDSERRNKIHFSSCSK